MRFLIMPNHPFPYDQRMVYGLAKGFWALGHEAHPLVRPCSDADVARMCKSRRIEVLLQVNRFRPVDPPLPPSVRHIAWFQDVFPETIETAVLDHVRDSDVVYALGDPHVLGLNVPLPCLVSCLVTGVDEDSLVGETGSIQQTVDFSLCGFIPRPVSIARSIPLEILWRLDTLLERIQPGGLNIFWLLRRLFFRRYIPVDYVPYRLLVTLREVVEAMYRPLRGELDIHLLSTAMRERTNSTAGSDAVRVPKSGSKNGATAEGRWNDSRRRTRLLKYLFTALSPAPERSTAIERVISYFAREYPRLLDRLALVRRVLRISDSVELYGPGWDLHDEFRPHHRGVLESLRSLLSVYRRTRINLGNNTHGLGLHSRTLECMAVGGFIFTHASPNDAKPGGMHTSFEPGVHYGMFDPDNFEEEALRWLRDQVGRKVAGQKAAAIVREKHLWRHRARQIISDLRA